MQPKLTVYKHHSQLDATKINKNCKDVLREELTCIPLANVSCRVHLSALDAIGIRTVCYAHFSMLCKDMKEMHILLSHDI